MKYRTGKTYDSYESNDEDFGKCLHCENYAQTFMNWDITPRYIHVNEPFIASSSSIQKGNNYMKNQSPQRGGSQQVKACEQIKLTKTQKQKTHTEDNKKLSMIL